MKKLIVILFENDLEFKELNLRHGESKLLKYYKQHVIILSK